MTSKTVTDEEMEAQGKVFQWVPAGTIIVPHIDVLYPNDLQSPVSPKSPGVLPYRVDEATDLNGMINPWKAFQYHKPMLGTISSPDDPTLTIDGDVHFTSKVSKTNVADPGIHAIASQYGGAGQRSWVQMFYLARPLFQWAKDGTNPVNHSVPQMPRLPPPSTTTCRSTSVPTSNRSKVEGRESRRVMATRGHPSVPFRWSRLQLRSRSMPTSRSRSALTKVI